MKKTDNLINTLNRLERIKKLQISTKGLFYKLLYGIIAILILFAIIIYRSRNFGAVFI